MKERPFFAIWILRNLQHPKGKMCNIVYKDTKTYLDDFTKILPKTSHERSYFTLFFFLHVHISMCYTTNLSYKKIEGEAIFCYLNIKKSSASEGRCPSDSPAGRCPCAPPRACRPLEPRFPLIGLQTILMPEYGKYGPECEITSWCQPTKGA